MPPRGRGAQSDEVKKQNFDNWQASEENSLCLKIFAVRKNESHELGKIQDGTDDIIDDWQPVLNNIFKLVETLKVPGRKAKQYEQFVFRTMVFKRLQEDFIEIDGIKYEVSNSVN